MKIKGWRCALVDAAELGMTAVTHRHFLQASIDHEIDQRGERQDAVRNEVALEPVEHRADRRADDDDREADLWVEVLADVKISAGAYRTLVDDLVGADSRRPGHRYRASAVPTADRVRRARRLHREARITLRTLGEHIHLVIG